MQLGTIKKPHKQISLFSVQFNIFFTKFSEIIPYTICHKCYKFYHLTFRCSEVAQSWTFLTAQITLADLGSTLQQKKRKSFSSPSFPFHSHHFLPSGGNNFDYFSENQLIKFRAKLLISDWPEHTHAWRRKHAPPLDPPLAKRHIRLQPTFRRI